MSWIADGIELLRRLEATQDESLGKAASICAASILRDGVVFAFGSGHSRIPVEELFPRHGAFPGFQPLVELSMTFHTEVVGSNGQRQAMFIERVEGLAERILASYDLKPVDSFLVFSVSGHNAVPLEIAMLARQAGCKVIAVTSVDENLAEEATHSSHTRLIDHADVVIDIGTPIGDALVHVDGLDEPIGAGSTLVATAVVNEIKVRTARLLVEKGFTPPVITSRRLVGAERADALFEAAYLEFARRYVRTLRTKPAKKG